jgi:hypothetical protein
VLRPKSKLIVSSVKNSSGCLSENRIKITNIMGAYKGRVNTRHRKRRFAKNERIKALASVKKEAAPPTDVAGESKAQPDTSAT